MSAADGSWLTALSDWAVGLMGVLGPWGAGVAIALENLFPPLPSEVILPIAGIAAYRGEFTLVEALFWTTAGSVVGAYMLYFIGAAFGARRIRRIFEVVPLLKAEDVDRTVEWFGRHGNKAVFFGRMLPIFRSLISIPAGVSRMSLWRFGVFTTLGSLIWNSIFVMAGYWLGDQWKVVEKYSDVLQYVVIIGVLLIVAGLVFVRVRGAMREKKSLASDAVLELDAENPSVADEHRDE